MDEGFFILQRIEAPLGSPVDFQIVEANPASAIQSGVRNVVGTSFRQAFPAEEEVWYQTFDDVLITGEAIRCERLLVTQMRVLELYAFRLRGQTTQTVAVIFKDITERKAAEQALVEADRRKDEFLATLAHELRNPLAPICNSLQLLRIYSCKDSDFEETLEMMDRQFNYMLRLVDDLMEVSRITRGSVELRKEETDLATIIRMAVETSRPLIQELEHELTVSIPQAIIPIYGDVVRLGQVFANLLNNAAKYTDRSGHISLSARQEGNVVDVAVRDTGIGITPTMLPSVFDMFTQADRASKRTQGGLGIGLTLAKRFVEMHGGSMSAHSEGPGKGSVFSVRLPVRDADQKATNESVLSAAR